MQRETNDVDLPEIPPKFAQYAEEIRATARDTVRFELTPATSLKPWQSKVGGEPYLPLTEEYPCNFEGKPLMLLAQINFSEMPHLSGYPDKGILEFYIDAYDEDGLMGLNFDDRITQDKFRVLYFDKVEEDRSKLRRGIKKYQNRENDEIDFPLQDNTNYSIKFFHEKQYMTGYDYRFEQMSFGEDYDMIDAYNEEFSGEVHRIGGYPFFTQTDPREGSPSLQEYELLLQLSSDNSRDEGINIMWGDMGVGAFFIRPEDLKKRDFTNVLYNWDCC